MNSKGFQWLVDRVWISDIMVRLAGAVNVRD
jgi:hypothetical protein